MTDGERLVWAAAFARALERDEDGAFAARVAARAVQRLRDTVIANAKINFTIDERDMLDEIASVP